MEEKMFVCGFDGTLIDEEEAIPMTTVLAIDQYRMLGGKFVIATERVPASIFFYNQDFNFLDYIVACNGAYIYDQMREKAIYKKPLGKTLIRTIKQSFETVAVIYFCTPSAWHLYASTIYQQKNDKIMKSEIKDFNQFLSQNKNNIYKLELHFSNLEEAKKAFKELKSMHLEIEANLTSLKNHYLIEIMAKGVGKYEAISQIAKIEKIKMKEIVAVGNNKNDLKLLKKVGHSFAVSNASEEVKEVAKEKTSSNNALGVEKILEKIIKLH